MTHPLEVGSAHMVETKVVQPRAIASKWADEHERGGGSGARPDKPLEMFARCLEVERGA
jgi:hypothetical protein